MAELVINGKRAESDINVFRHSGFAEKRPVRGMYDEGADGVGRAARSYIASTASTSPALIH